MLLHKQENMSEICQVDKNIILSAENIVFLKEQYISIADFDISSNTLTFEKVGFLVLHSFLPNEKLQLIKNCRYIGIRAHNTDYISQEICNKQHIKIE